MKYLFAALALMASAAQATGTQDFEVSELGIVRGSGYAFITIAPAQTISDCPRKDMIRWELSTEEDKAIFSMALTAQTTNQKLRVHMVDGDCLGDSGRPNITRLVK
ncbi:hypothetical protein EYS14_14665 [Alteromonadaceae bacterium M269]|nr:hypothetical protein EYS14_14665 [Alteromonadaceae bacterium M269]